MNKQELADLLMAVETWLNEYLGASSPEEFHRMELLRDKLEASPHSLTEEGYDLAVATIRSWKGGGLSASTDERLQAVAHALEANKGHPAMQRCFAQIDQQGVRCSKRGRGATSAETPEPDAVTIFGKGPNDPAMILCAKLAECGVAVKIRVMREALDRLGKHSLGDGRSK